MTVLAVGLMSGTSADGIDAALVELSDGPGVRLVAFETFPYNDEFRNTILENTEHGSVETLARLDMDLGLELGRAASAMFDRAEGRKVDFVASHGHTFWHEPGRASLQLGNPQVIAECCGVTVVSGFRSRDIAAGGQGAPLVPIADALLFRARGSGRVLLNIGGIANVTWVPAGDGLNGVTAFDTGPGMVLIDLMVRHFHPGRRFDKGGAMASRGRSDSRLLERLLEHPYFQVPPPKSTGRELFGTRMAKEIIECAPRAADALRTAVELTARSIAGQVHRWVDVPENSRELVVSGGGCHNKTLVQCLENEFRGWRVRMFTELFFDGDAKEAVAFAFLGWLTLNHRPGNIPAATGAGAPRVLGTVTPA